MSPRPKVQGLVPALAVASVCIAALGAATFGARERAPAADARPAARASVDVARTPAASQPACETCAMGAAGSAR